MKKINLLLLVILLSTFSYGQSRRSSVNWMSLAIKAGGGISAMNNSDIGNDINTSLDFLSPIKTYGLRFGLTHGDYVGLSFEGLKTDFAQRYNISSPTAYTKTTTFVARELAVFLRYTGDYGFYAEFGPKITSLDSIVEDNSVTGNFFPTDNLSEKYNMKYKSLILGVGFSAMRTQRVTITLGVRGSYSLDDVTLDDYSIMNDGIYVPDYLPIAETRPFSLQIMAELNYFFAFWGDASCGRGRIMFFQ